MRKQRIQLFTQLNVWLVAGHIETDMQEFRSLFLDRFHNGRWAVPSINNANTTCEVDQLPAIHIRDHGSAGMRCSSMIEHAHTIGHSGTPASDQLLALGQLSSHCYA